MKIKEELLIKQAKEGYTVCYKLKKAIPYAMLTSAHCTTTVCDGSWDSTCPLHAAPTIVSIRISRVWQVMTAPCIATTRRYASPRVCCTSLQMICPSVWSLLSATESSALPTAPTTSSIATARASFPLPCNRLSATCSAKTDGQAK